MRWVKLVFGRERRTADDEARRKIEAMERRLHALEVEAQVEQRQTAGPEAGGARD